MADRSLMIGIAVSAAIGAPLVASALVRMRVAGPHVRAIASIALIIALAASVCASLCLGTCADCESGPAWVAVTSSGGNPLVRFDSLSAVLMPYVTILALATAVAVPVVDIDTRTMSRSLLGTSLTLMLLATAHPGALVALWIATALVTWRSAALSPGGSGAARTYALYMAPALAMVSLGAWLLSSAPAGTAHTAGAWMVACAVMVRKGIFPFHSWYPALFSGANLSTALSATMPQVAAYTAIRLLVGAGQETHPQLELLVVAALLTCVYGAALAVVQHDVRGLVGTLAMSQSALVLVGLAGSSTELSGALAVWMSSGIVITGVALVARSLEARAGHLSIAIRQGRFADAPALASCFLLFGLAGAGLPGTFSFVADDLIVSASLDHRVGAGLMVIASTVLAAIALMRAWFNLFGGRPASGPHHPVLAREAAALSVLLAITFGVGLFPGPFVGVAERVAASLAPGDAIRHQGANPPTIHTHPAKDRQHQP